MYDIKKKTEYCLNCKAKPCHNACPLGNDIPAFIKYIKEEKVEEAYKILSKTTVLRLYMWKNMSPYAAMYGGLHTRNKRHARFDRRFRKIYLGYGIKK